MQSEETKIRMELHSIHKDLEKLNYTLDKLVKKFPDNVYFLGVDLSPEPCISAGNNEEE